MPSIWNFIMEPYLLDKLVTLNSPIIFTLNIEKTTFKMDNYAFLTKPQSPQGYCEYMDPDERNTIYT